MAATCRPLLNAVLDAFTAVAADAAAAAAAAYVTAPAVVVTATTADTAAAAAAAFATAAGVTEVSPAPSVAAGTAVVGATVAIATLHLASQIWQLTECTSSYSSCLAMIAAVNATTFAIEAIFAFHSAMLGSQLLNVGSHQSALLLPASPPHGCPA